MEDTSFDTVAQRNTFQAAVNGVFSRWMALRLAVQNEFGGPESQEIADELKTTVFEWFDNGEIYPDELRNLFDDVFSNDLNTELEDGSSREVAEVICSVYRECIENKFDRATSLATAAPVSLDKCAKVKADSDDEDDEDDGEAEEGDAMDASSPSASSSAPVAPQPQQQQRQPRIQKAADGWSSVGGASGGKKEKKEKNIQKGADGWSSVGNSGSSSKGSKKEGKGKGAGDAMED